jgi:methyl-accepting chemotaxis protein
LGFIAINVLFLYWGARSAKLEVANEQMLENMAFLMKHGAYFIILFTIFLGCMFLLLSRRIAGLAYRIRKSMERIAKGDYSFEGRLRNRDYLKGIADSMNLMIVLRSQGLDG